MVKDLWGSVEESPWSSELTGLGLSFMLALCMSLGFDCCWAFLWGVLPSSWLIEGYSIHHVLYSVLQLWTVCVEADSSLCTSFEASLSLLFSCLFWVISPLFGCIFRSLSIEVSVASTPFFTFFRCYLLLVPLLVGFLFQQVYWCLQLPPTLFFISWRGRENGLRQWVCILWYLKYQPIEKRWENLWICTVLTMIFHPTSHFLESVLKW